MTAEDKTANERSLEERLGQPWTAAPQLENWRNKALVAVQKGERREAFGILNRLSAFAPGAGPPPPMTLAEVQEVSTHSDVIGTILKDLTPSRSKDDEAVLDDLANLLRGPLGSPEADFAALRAVLATAHDELRWGDRTEALDLINHAVHVCAGTQPSVVEWMSDGSNYEKSPHLALKKELRSVTPAAIPVLQRLIDLLPRLQHEEAHLAAKTELENQQYINAHRVPGHLAMRRLLAFLHFPPFTRDRLTTELKGLINDEIASVKAVDIKPILSGRGKDYWERVVSKNFNIVALDLSKSPESREKHSNEANRIEAQNKELLQNLINLPYEASPGYAAFILREFTLVRAGQLGGELANRLSRMPLISDLEDRLRGICDAHPVRTLSALSGYPWKDKPREDGLNPGEDGLKPENRSGRWARP